MKRYWGLRSHQDVEICSVGASLCIGAHTCLRLSSSSDRAATSAQPGAGARQDTFQPCRWAQLRLWRPRYARNRGPTGPGRVPRGPSLFPAPRPPIQWSSSPQHLLLLPSCGRVPQLHARTRVRHRTRLWPGWDHPRVAPHPYKARHPSRPVPKCHGHRGLAPHCGGHSGPLPRGGRRPGCPQSVPISPLSTGQRMLSLCSALGSPPRGHLSADARAQLAARLPWQLRDRNAAGFMERGGRRGHMRPFRPQTSAQSTTVPMGGLPTPANHGKPQGLSKLSLFQMLKDYSFSPLFLN